MTDAQFLYQLMLRTNDSRRESGPVPDHRLSQAADSLRLEFEAHDDLETLRERALDVASLALRMAVEHWKGVAA